VGGNVGRESSVSVVVIECVELLISSLGDLSAPRRDGVVDA